MRISLFCSLVCAVVLCATPCYGSGNSQQNNAQTSERILSRGGLVFIGVSGRLSSRDASIQNALNDAARRLSFFHSVSGYTFKQENISGGTFGFNVNTEVQLRYDEELEKYLEQLEFNPERDVYENNNAVFVITRIASNNTMPAFRGHSFGSNRPAWVESPPVEINGFTTGIGYSGRLVSYGATVIKSYENAVLAIIENMGIYVSGEFINYQNNYSTFSSAFISTGESIAIGTLKNFYIVESWTDPANLSVWTLAVASHGE